MWEFHSQWCHGSQEGKEGEIWEEVQIPSTEGDAQEQEDTYHTFEKENIFTEKEDYREGPTSDKLIRRMA